MEAQPEPVLKVIMGDTVFRFKQVFGSDITIGDDFILFDCEICNALVKDVKGHADYHLMKGEIPA